MARFDAYRVLSRPCEVHFEGFASTTARLQQAGWEISAEQLVEFDSVRLALRHQGLGLRALTGRVDFDYFDRTPGVKPPAFQIQRMASRMDVLLHDNPTRFAPIDAMPQMVRFDPRSIDDFNIFAVPLARTEELIVEPETVMGLLERIRAMQSPEQAAIRARNRQRDAREPEARQRQVFHAQILSLAA